MNLWLGAGWVEGGGEVCANNKLTLAHSGRETL